MKALSFSQIPVTGLENSTTLGGSNLRSRQKRKLLEVWNKYGGLNITVKFTTCRAEFQVKSTFVRQQQNNLVLKRARALFGIHSIGRLIVDEDNNIVSQKTVDFSSAHAAAVLIPDYEGGPNSMSILVYIPSQDWKPPHVPRSRRLRSNHPGGWRDH